MLPSRRGPTEARERLEELEELLERLREANEEAPVLVEGEKDLAALRALGLGGEILRVHAGEAIFTRVESIARAHRRVILLLDWDRGGGRLTRLVKEALAANGASGDDAFRRGFARLTRKKVLHVEALDTYLRSLRSEARG